MANYLGPEDQRRSWSQHSQLPTAGGSHASHDGLSSARDDGDWPPLSLNQPSPVLLPSSWGLPASSTSVTQSQPSMTQDDLWSHPGKAAQAHQCDLLLKYHIFSCWIGPNSLEPAGGSYPSVSLDNLRPLAGSSRSHLQEPTADDSHPAESQNVNDSDGQPVVYPQEPVGGNHLNPLSGSFMEGHAFQQNNYHDQEVSNVAQRATQVPATSTDPTSFVPGSSQATQSGSGSRSVHDQDDFMAMLGQGRPLNLKAKHLSNHATSNSPMISRPSASQRSKKRARKPIISESLIKRVKHDSSEYMISSLFEESLFPNETTLNRLAKAALDRAADIHNEGSYFITFARIS